jgi:ABC-type nickel/cobalt efflux system permease component RcnA
LRRLLLAATVALALLAPAAASAHPLGNFTVNQFARIEPSGDRIYIFYVLDMAEIPTFQARSDVAAKGQGAYSAGLAAQIRENLELDVGGRRLELRELGHSIAFPGGVGGLETTRLEIVFATGAIQSADRPLPMTFRDRNFPDRMGWREIVVRGEAGAVALAASVPAESVSDELRRYPDDLLESPLDVRSATAELTPGSEAGPPPELEGGVVDPRKDAAAPTEHGFTSLVAKEELSAGVVLVSLLVAMFWGAAHALSPGHGKAIVAAYLVGSRGKPRHALYLGLITTVTHTIGVFALGLVTLALSQLVVPERLYPWLNLASALLVVTVGVAVLRVRILDWMRTRRTGTAAHDHADHHHGHHHDHGHHDHHHPDQGHDHGHEHLPGARTGWRGLLAVGVSGGLLPCPSALVVLLAAISLHRVGYGLVLIVAFSIGLAATITAIGLLAIGARGIFGRMSFQGPVLRLLPAASALVILAFGLAMTVRAVPAIA